MSREVQDASLRERGDFLFNVMKDPRFLQMQGIGNEVPFFVTPYSPAEHNDVEKLRDNLIKKLGNEGITILDLSLYDLCHEIMVDEGDWAYWIEQESSLTKEQLKEEFQGILDVANILTPKIAERTAESEFDILFLSGVGEVFPFIRSHNVLNNLQKVAKSHPTVLFFPGMYTHSQEKGASLDLFAPHVNLRNDKYYRAFNIFDRDIQE